MIVLLSDAQHIRKVLRVYLRQVETKIEDTDEDSALFIELIEEEADILKALSYL